MKRLFAVAFLLAAALEPASAQQIDLGALAGQANGATVGYIIQLFGLLPEFSGKGLGKWLLVEAVERAWSLGASRVWLHTCTLDSPAALPNYLARGFKPFRTERYEVEGVRD